MNTSTKKSAWADNPDYRIDIVPAAKRILIVLGKFTLVDSNKALVLQENDYQPLYYFPREDIDMKLLQPILKQTFCPYKGDAVHWALIAGERRVDVAAWSYDDPFSEVAQIKGCISFYPEVSKDILIR